MKFPVPVRYEYRWLGPFDEYYKIDDKVNAWKEVELPTLWKGYKPLQSNKLHSGYVGITLAF